MARPEKIGNGIPSYKYFYQVEIKKPGLYDQVFYSN
jgi:hypothetical protein